MWYWVWRLDRWGRSVADLVSSLQELTELGVGFVLTEALDFTTPVGRAMAGLLAVFAAFERDILRERVRAGLDHARSISKRLGRPPLPAAVAADARRLAREGISKSKIARQLGSAERPSDASWPARKCEFWVLTQPRRKFTLHPILDEEKHFWCSRFLKEGCVPTGKPSSACGHRNPSSSPFQKTGYEEPPGVRLDRLPVGSTDRLHDGPREFLRGR